MPDQSFTIGAAGDFTSIAAWEALSDVTDGYYQGVLIDNTLYAETVVIAGSTGTSTIANYVWLTADDAVYHAGVDNAGAAIQSQGNVDSIFIDENFVRLHKLRVVESAVADQQSVVEIGIGNTGILIDRCILDANDRVASVRDSDCISVDAGGAGSANATVYATLLLRAWRNAILGNLFDEIRCQHVTAYDHNITETTASQRGVIFVNRTTAAATVAEFFNTVTAKTKTDQTVIQFREGSGTVYTGSNNASGDATAPGPNSFTNIVDANEFTDVTNDAAYNLIPLETGNLFEGGIDTTGSLPDARINPVDIRGVAWRTPNPSIGCYEVPAAGVARMFVGGTPLSTVGDIQVGGQVVQEVYVGSTKVFPAA